MIQVDHGKHVSWGWNPTKICINYGSCAFDKKI